MELKGKKIVFLGDSITEGSGVDNHSDCYVEVFKRISELSEAYNNGIGGTRIAPQTVPINPKWDMDFISRVDDMETDVDAVVVFGGTNDFGHGDAPFGGLGDINCKTFCGACYVLMKKLTEKYHRIPIVVITPLHRVSEKVTINEIGIACKPLVEYVDIIKKTAEEFSLPVLDLYGTSGMTTVIDAQNDYYFADGLHPNKVGHERIAKLLKRFFENQIVE